jgi:hypothetical protein
MTRYATSQAEDFDLANDLIIEAAKLVDKLRDEMVLKSDMARLDQALAALDTAIARSATTRTKTS